MTIFTLYCKIQIKITIKFSNLYLWILLILLNILFLGYISCNISFCTLQHAILALISSLINLTLLTFQITSSWFPYLFIYWNSCCTAHICVYSLKYILNLFNWIIWHQDKYLKKGFLPDRKRQHIINIFIIKLILEKSKFFWWLWNILLNTEKKAEASLP